MQIPCTKRLCVNIYWIFRQLSGITYNLVCVIITYKSQILCNQFHNFTNNAQFHKDKTFS